MPALKFSRSKIILSLLLSLSTTLAGCGKKSVTDPGPQFSMETADFHINGATTSGILLKRDDRDYSPMIHIDTQKPETITSVTKTLTCGAFKVAITRGSNDAHMLSFKFNEDEFKGISKLPSYAACSLSVAVTNEIGSVVTKTQALFFYFDKGPPLEVTRQTAASGMNATSDTSLIPIENYVIRNSLTYAVRIRFMPSKIFDYSPCFHFRAQTPGQASNLPLMCDKVISRAQATQLTLDGDYHELERDTSRSLTFTLSPGGWATVAANFKVADETSAPFGGARSVFDTTAYLRTFAGIYISGFLNYQQEPLSLVPTLPLTPLRPAEVVAETLTPVKQTPFAGVSIIPRPADNIMR